MLPAGLHGRIRGGMGSAGAWPEEPAQYVLADLSRRTLGAYALFPYFPSEPPRIVFAGADLPGIITDLRRFNLWILGNLSIHSSVFPSAHVSSALSAAWGLFVTLPERPWIGWAMALYGVCVAIATVYGRYHYAVDVAAGAALSLTGPIVFAYLKSRGA